MRIDTSPEPTRTNEHCIERVVFIEEHDAFKKIVEGAQMAGAISFDPDGNPMFWVVFPEEPLRVYGASESLLALHCKIH